MADVKISALPAVSSPAGTDEFAVNQAGTTKKMTLTQLMAAAIPGAFSTLAASGNTSLGGDAVAATLTASLNTAAGQVRAWQMRTAGTLRWAVQAEATAEGGSSAGSDFEIIAYDDAGAAIGDALKITRADMSAVFGGTLRAVRLGVGGAPDVSKGLVLANTALTGTAQIGADVHPVFGSGATASGHAIVATLETPAAAFTMADAAGLRIKNAVKGAGSTITTLYGLYVEEQTQGGTNWGIYVAGGSSRLDDVTIAGDFDHDGTNFGFAGVTPSAPQTGYTTFTNLSTDRTCDADTVLVAELADIVGTLIVDLKAKGIIAA